MEEKAAHLASSFGRAFDGEICVLGPRAEFLRRGRFTGRCLPISRDRGVIGRLPFVAWVLWRVARARLIERRRVIVISYDPFQSGLIGLLAKWLCGAALICEVNGDFGRGFALSPRYRGKIPRQRRRFRIGSFVLNHADGVKSLYPGITYVFELRSPPPTSSSFFNLVKQDVFAREAVAEQEDLILFVGHPFHLKGVDLLLEAFHRLSPEFPSWRLMAIGFRLREEAHAWTPDLPETVDFLGPQPPGVIAEWMARCRVFVLPSRTEAMGRVLMEAAMVGRARVASRVGGIPTFVEDGVDGLLFEPEDVDDLERQLRRAMEDRDLQRRVGARAHERALREFSEEAYLRNYQALIKRVDHGGVADDAEG